MLTRYLWPAFTALLAAGCAAIAPPPPAMSEDGLRRIDNSEFDSLYIRDGVGFDQFSTLYVEPLEVTFERGWQASQNMADPNRISNSDLRRIKQRISEDFADNFVANLAEASGLTLVSQPQADSLILRPKITNLYINNPSNEIAYQLTILADNAASMTMNVEILDGETDQVLLRLKDKGEARYFAQYPGEQGSEQDVVKNKRETVRLLQLWADSLQTVMLTWS